MQREVILGGFTVPSWLLSTGLVVATSLLMGAIVSAIMLTAPQLSHALSFGPILQDREVARRSPAELAAAGDPVTMKALERKAKEKPTVESLVALAKGRIAQRKLTLASLAEDLKRNPRLGYDPDVLQHLREATEDPLLAPDALRILASIPGPASVDIIYDVWVGTKDRTETTRLAEGLIFVESVRQKASPALAVVLDLRTATKCEDVSRIVDNAMNHGDHRSARLLGMLTLRQGCGPGKLSDCYACLRGDHRLLDAVSAVVNRPPPKL